jgi:hypothetical protein
MKIATWNVNGIRARQAQLQDLLAAEQPDVVCLQEIKAGPGQVPELMVAPGEYWTYWHGGGGYSGVALLVRRAFSPEPPRFAHPAFDYEHRIVEATVALPPDRCANLREPARISCRIGAPAASSGEGPPSSLAEKDVALRTTAGLRRASSSAIQAAAAGSFKLAA